MSVESWIHQIATNIVHKVHPKKIILFGSYACGRPGKNSDVDLLVVLDKTMNRAKRCVLVGRAIGEHIYPLDVLIRSEKEIKEQLTAGDAFIEEILESGRVLYEAKA